MTVEAPAHRHGLRLLRQGHLIDPPMTGRAAQAFRHMDRMIEIDVIRQGMDPIPRDRLARGETRANRRQDRRLGEELRVAGHTDIGWWNASPARRLDPKMAVAAVKPIEADVMSMAEWNRLRGYEILARDVG